MGAGALLLFGSLMHRTGVPPMRVWGWVALVSLCFFWPAWAALKRAWWNLFGWQRLVLGEDAWTIHGPWYLGRERCIPVRELVCVASSPGGGWAEVDEPEHIF